MTSIDQVKLAAKGEDFSPRVSAIVALLRSEARDHPTGKDVVTRHYPTSLVEAAVALLDYSKLPCLLGDGYVSVAASYTELLHHEAQR